MRAVDTNVIIRYLVDDDPAQAAKARTLIREDRVFISRTVLLEVEWVLRATYKMPVPEIIAALRALAGLPGVTVEDAFLAAKALDWTETGMDFADALHLATAGACSEFATFDQRLARTASHHGAVPVRLL